MNKMGDDVCWLDRSNDDSHPRDLIGKIAKNVHKGYPGKGRKEGERKNTSRAARYVPRVHPDVDSDNLFETFFGSNQHPGNSTETKTKPHPRDRTHVPNLFGLFFPL